MVSKGTGSLFNVSLSFFPMHVLHAFIYHQEDFLIVAHISKDLSTICLPELKAGPQHGNRMGRDGESQCDLIDA